MKTQMLLLRVTGKAGATPVFNLKVWPRLSSRSVSWKEGIARVKEPQSQASKSVSAWSTRVSCLRLCSAPRACGDWGTCIGSHRGIPGKVGRGQAALSTGCFGRLPRFLAAALSVLCCWVSVPASSAPGWLGGPRGFTRRPWWHARVETRPPAHGRSTGLWSPGRGILS